jgi:hypothetical protein
MCGSPLLNGKNRSCRPFSVISTAFTTPEMRSLPYVALERLDAGVFKGEFRRADLRSPSAPLAISNSG